MKRPDRKATPMEEAMRPNALALIGLVALLTALAAHARADALYVVPGRTNTDAPEVLSVSSASLLRSMTDGKRELKFQLPEDLVGPIEQSHVLKESGSGAQVGFSHFQGSELSANCASQTSVAGTVEVTSCRIIYPPGYVRTLPSAAAMTGFLAGKYSANPTELGVKLKLMNAFRVDPEGWLILRN